MTQKIKVTCYAGYKGEERPASFELGERRLVVVEVVDRWYDPDYNCFKVIAEDGAQYLLRHDLNQDVWELVQRCDDGGEAAH